jgi:hypothetical protein
VTGGISASAFFEEHIQGVGLILDFFLQAASLFFVCACFKALFEPIDLSKKLDFFRYKIATLQNRVGQPQIFRSFEIGPEIDRFPFAARLSNSPASIACLIRSSINFSIDI